MSVQLDTISILILFTLVIIPILLCFQLHKRINKLETDVGYDRFQIVAQNYIKLYTLTSYQMELLCKLNPEFGKQNPDPSATTKIVFNSLYPEAKKYISFT